MGFQHRNLAGARGAGLDLGAEIEAALTDRHHAGGRREHALLELLDVGCIELSGDFWQDLGVNSKSCVKTHGRRDFAQLRGCRKHAIPARRLDPRDNHGDDAGGLRPNSGRTPVRVVTEAGQVEVGMGVDPVHPARVRQGAVKH